jgi:hypothetical protein
MNYKTVKTLKRNIKYPFSFFSYSGVCLKIVTNFEFLVKAISFNVHLPLISL